MHYVPRRGEIWSVPIPGQPYDPHQPRPALIVSSNARNRLRDDVFVIPIFSRGKPGRTRVPLTAGMGGLRHDSLLFCEEVTTLHHDFLINGPFGPPVPQTILQRVVVALRYAVT